MPNEMKRFTVSVREQDYQYLQNLEKQVSTNIGFEVGISFVLRMIIRYLVRSNANVAGVAGPTED